MSHACCGGPEINEERRGGVASATTNALALAAAPTFALLALWTGLSNDQSVMLCTGYA